MSISTPKVSVLMSVYNGSRYLQKSLESILNQTFTDFEFIIIDDGSTDNTWEILTKYADQDQRIKLFKNEENIGLTKSLNKGLILAQGEYVARQDADDISLPERFEKQVDFLNKQLKVILVSGNYESIDSEGSLLGKPKPAGGSDITAWYLLFYNRIGAHGLAMFRRDPVMNIGGYSESYRYSQDYELWSRLVKVGDVVILPDVLQLYRRNHSGSISFRANSEQELLALSATRRNIKEILGEEISLAEAAELKDFWLKKFPDVQRISTINSNLKKIYRAFLQQRIQQGTSSSVLSRQLSNTIGKQFLRWKNSLTTKRSLYSKLKVLAFAFAWHPMGVMDLWLSKIQSAFHS